MNQANNRGKVQSREGDWSLEQDIELDKQDQYWKCVDQSYNQKMSGEGLGVMGHNTPDWGMENFLPCLYK